MQNKTGKGSFKSNKQNLNFEFSLVAYEEGKLHVVYCPALDLFGYGKTEREAERSFSTVLEEHIRYTTNKNTFLKDLKQHGWKVSGKKYSAPSLGQMLKENDQFSDIFNHKDYFKYNKTVSVPAFAA